MNPIVVTRHVNAPIERVEALLTDLENAAERIDGIMRVEVLSDGPFSVGTRWRETRVMFGKEATEEMEIIEYVPGEYYAAKAESCGSRYRTVFRYEPSGEGTDVTVEFGATPVKFFAKLLSPLSGLMSKMLVKCLNDDLSDLARIAESADTTSPHKS